MTNITINCVPVLEAYGLNVFDLFGPVEKVWLSMNKAKYQTKITEYTQWPYEGRDRLIEQIVRHLNEKRMDIVALCRALACLWEAENPTHKLETWTQ